MGHFLLPDAVYTVQCLCTCILRKFGMSLHSILASQFQSNFKWKWSKVKKRICVVAQFVWPWHFVRSIHTWELTLTLLCVCISLLMLCVISDSHSSSPGSTCARCCHNYFSAAFWWLVTLFNVVKTNHGAKRTQFLQITCYCKIVVCKNVEILEENHSFAFSDKLCLLHVWCHSVDLSATLNDQA